ncbi:hypothetical protein V1527DRAFT_21551 [Lipomyces starkeyi]
MAFVFRTILVLLVLSYSALGGRYVSKTTLCLFKGYQQANDFTFVWLEQKGSQGKMPVHYLHEIGFSHFTTVKAFLNNGSAENALLYLYPNNQKPNEHVAFVNYDKTAYHFTASQELNFENWRVVGGKKVYVYTGSCVEPEYNWQYSVSSTIAPVQGYIERDCNYP